MVFDGSCICPHHRIWVQHLLHQRFCIFGYIRRKFGGGAQDVVVESLHIGSIWILRIVIKWQIARQHGK